MKTGLFGKTFAAGTVLLGLLAGGCTNTGKQAPASGISAIADSLFTGSSDIRSFNFGMAREEFDLGDGKNVLENERDFAVESIQPKTSDSIFAECSYRFEDDLLQSGEVNVFCPGDSLSRLVQDTLLKVLNKRLGQAVESRGFYTWKTKSRRGYKLEVFMGDVSQELGSPGQFVTGIRFYAELVEKPALALAARYLHKVR